MRVPRDRGPLCRASSASLVLIHMQLDKVVDARIDPLILYRDLGQVVIGIFVIVETVVHRSLTFAPQLLRDDVIVVVQLLVCLLN